MAEDESTGQALMPTNGNGNSAELSVANAKFRKDVAELSTIIDRMRFMERLGKQYEGNRNIYRVAGYPELLTFDHYYALYRRGGLAGRVVDMASQTTWRTPPTIIEPGMDPVQGTNFTREFERMAKRLRLWSMFERVDRLSGIGRYGVLLIGTPGDDADLTKELQHLDGPDDVIYLAVFHENVAKIRTWVTDPNDPRFGRAQTYNLDFSSSTGSFPATTLPVDASRLIHVAEDRINDHVYGRPRLERVYNYFMDLEKITAATGESYWQLAARVLQAKAAPNAVISDALAEDMSTQLEEIIHDLRRIFIAQGVELEWLPSTPPDPSQAASLFLTLIAGSSGYPRRILFGSETGERASEQDQRHFFGLINEREERFAEPDIVRAFIDRLIQYGGLPKPESPEGYEVVWPALYELSEQEKANANLSRANAARALTPLGSSPMDIVDVDDDRNVWLKPTTGQNIGRELGAPEDREHLLDLPQGPDEPQSEEPQRIPPGISQPEDEMMY